VQKKSKGILRVATSNIVVPGTKQTFPADFQNKSRLNFYSSMFNTLELNSTFYKVPMLSTFEKWSLDVPKKFQFTIKLWKEVTHIKNLKFELENIDLFFKAAEGTRDKKGCILIQFPGKITFDFYNEVEQVFLRIRDNDPNNKWRKAVEFRSPTWYVTETTELLDEHGASMVLHDIPKSRSVEPNKRASFVYIRFHGPRGDYRGSYSDKQLQQYFDRIKEWLNAGKDVYAYFNNTMGSALKNAMTLKSMGEN